MCVNTAKGVLKSCVARGRLFTLSAMPSRSTWLKVLRSKYCYVMEGTQECVVLAPFCAYRANIRAPALWLIAISRSS